MKKTIITIVTIAAACIGLVTVDDISRRGKGIAVANIKKKIKEDRSEDNKKVLDDYAEVKKELEALQAVEDKKVTEELDAYKKSINYASRKEEITSLASKKVSEFKTSIGYDDLKSNYKKEFDDALNAWKTENEFDKKIAAEKAKIDEAIKVSNNQKLIANISTNANSDFAKESTEKINEAIKETREKAIKAANDGMDAIKKEFEEFKKTAKKDYDAKLSELSSKVNVVRDEASKQASSDLKALETDVAEKLVEIRAKAIENESDEFKATSDKFSYYNSLVDALKKDEEKKVEDAIAALDDADLVAAWMNSNKIGKIGAASMLAVPFVPIAFAAYKYGTFVFKVVGKMTK